MANPGSTRGPPSITGSSLLLPGTNPNNNGTTTLSVAGAATLGSSTVTSSFIDDHGSSPGTDFSQLSATGDLSLGGTLVLGQGPSNNTGPCVVLTPGDVATLVTMQGTLSGTFANAPDGATLTMTSSCESVPPVLRIDYTPNSVTATLITGTVRSAVATHVAQSRARWREQGSRRTGSGARYRVPIGTRFTSSVSAPGRIRLTFVQLLPGRRVGRRCFAPTRATPRDRAWARTRTRGRLVVFVRAGTHRIRFGGRIGRSRLPVGRSALDVTAIGRDGTRSRTRTLHFTIAG